MDPWLRAMGFERVAFIPDREAGLKEGEKPLDLKKIEDEAPNVMDYSPWADVDLNLNPGLRVAAKKDPFIAAYMKSWDRMHALRD